jgi:hypothetical protein
MISGQLGSVRGRAVEMSGVSKRLTGDAISYMDGEAESFRPSRGRADGTLRVYPRTCYCILYYARLTLRRATDSCGARA